MKNTKLKAVKPAAPSETATTTRPSREAAEEAVRTLIRWAGDDPDREGLHDTPHRVIDSYEDYYSGYGVDPLQELLQVVSPLTEVARSRHNRENIVKLE